MGSAVSPRGKRELEDIIFTCGMQSQLNSIYTSRFVECLSPVENAFFLSRSRSDFVCVHCGIKDFDRKKMTASLETFKTVFPCCSVCASAGKSQVCLNPKPGKKAVVESKKKSSSSKSVPVTVSSISLPTSTISSRTQLTSLTASTSSGQAVAFADLFRKKRNRVSASKSSSSSKASAERVVVELDVNNNPNDTDIDINFDIDYSVTSDVEKRSINDVDESGPSKRKCDENECTICNEEDPPGKKSVVNWIDCEVCNQWAHLTCAYKSSWKKVRGVWVCDQDKSKV